ncbi:MAG: HAD family hydrolase [Cyanobacteria bacterium J06607_6]
MHLLFDLDGTLTNPAAGITACIRHALHELQVPMPAPAKLLQWIGPPLQDSFLTVCETPAQAHRAVQLYRDRFATIGLYENQVYDGVPAMLAALQQQGHTLWVCTSKPQIFAQKIIQHFQLAPYFADVYGSELNGDRAHKAALIAHVLNHASVRPDTAVMTGDRHYDIEGARQNAVRAIGVTWGFGTATELKTAGADALCLSPADFSTVLATV